MVEATLLARLTGIEVPEGEQRQDQIVVQIEKHLELAFADLDIDGVELQEPHLRVDLRTDDRTTAAADAFKP